MTTLNLEADINEQSEAMDERKWSKLQIEVCMNIANAKFYAFAAEADRMAEFVRLGMVPRLVAADYLHQSAAYNQLYFEYGPDSVQKIMAQAFEVAA